MRSLTLAAALLAITGLAPLASAQITVGPAGGGFQFTEIQDAIDVAPPNSIILVYPANYSKPLFIDKSLTIIGDTINTWTPILLQSAGTTPTAMVEITGIDALEEVRITGLRLRVAPETTHALYVHDCAGRVVVNNIVWLAAFAPYGMQTKAGVVIRDSDAVIGDDWDITRHFLGTESLASSSVAWALDLGRSSLWLSNSVLTSPALEPQAQGLVSAAGIRLTDSEITLANTTVRGGSGMYHCIMPDFGGCLFSANSKAGPAIHAFNSRVRVAGGTANLLKAGVAGGTANENYAVLLQNGSYFEHAADVVFENSTSSFSSTTISALGGSTVVARAHNWPNIELSAQRVSPGQAATMNTRGNPLSLHLLFYSTQMQLPIDEPLLQGPIILDIGAVVQLAEFATDANGNGSFGFGIPPIPQLIGFGVHFQTLELGGAGAFISNAALLTITDVN